MKVIANGALVVAGISLVAAIISRLTLTMVGPMGLSHVGLLKFTDTCLLVAIAFAVLQLVKAKAQ